MRYLLLLLTLAPFLLSCSNSQKIMTDNGDTSKPDNSVLILQSLYQSAIQDARNPEPREISRDLTTIRGNPSLIDTVINGIEHVLVVSWKSNPAYYPDSGTYNTGKYDIWITVAPQIKKKCEAYQVRFATEEKVEMRLRQLLGLQPNSQQKFFLELWVRPDDLYRPCPDNETGDMECELNLPKDVTPEYRNWFNSLRAVQYVDCSDTLFGQAGYPWTQLGYTYDWSPESKTHVGLSEFVVKQNVNVWVRSKVPTKEYCRVQ